MRFKFAPDVERLCEIARQIRVLESEKRDLAAVLMSELDAIGEVSWADDFLALTIVERPGQESADVAALKAAGLVEYIRRGDPVRYVTARRK